MITTLVVGILVSFFSEVFSMFPVVTKLPTIAGYDIDSAFTAAGGQIHQFLTDVWIVNDVLLGALFLFAYYGIKMILKLLLGHRAPGGYN